MTKIAIVGKRASGKTNVVEDLAARHLADVDFRVVSELDLRYGLVSPDEQGGEVVLFELQAPRRLPNVDCWLLARDKSEQNRARIHRTHSFFERFADFCAAFDAATPRPFDCMVVFTAPPPFASRLSPVDCRDVKAGYTVASYTPAYVSTLCRWCDFNRNPRRYVEYREALKRAKARSDALRLELEAEAAMRRAKARADVLRQELMRRAWHPSRLRSCLSHDEVDELL